MLPIVVAAMIAQSAALPTLFAQVAPTPVGLVGLTRTKGQDRAVVLLHGLHLHPANRDRAQRAEFSPWQEAGSPFVQQLAKHADVFSFAYAQTLPAPAIARSRGLVMGIAHLRALGYGEIVLLGFSAGGVIARSLVESNPDAGVRRVVQVSSPNGGSDWARSPIGVPKAQQPFVRSLTPQARDLEARRNPSIPAKVEFVCVVGRSARGNGDGFVRCDRQWPADLQRQGIPAERIACTHLEMMKNAEACNRLAELCRQPAPRWTATYVEKGRREILD